MVADEEPHPTGRKGAAKGSIKAGARTAPAWCPNEGTAVAQWPPRLAPPRLSPWQSCSCSLRTPSLVVGYLDNQLKGRSPAKLGPRPDCLNLDFPIASQPQTSQNSVKAKFGRAPVRWSRKPRRV